MCTKGVYCTGYTYDQTVYVYVEVPVKEDSRIGLNIVLPSCFVCE